MTTEYRRTDRFRGASFVSADLAGATFRECDLTGARIVASDLDGLRVSSHAATAQRITVNDVDVTEYVQAELDRWNPERARVRAMRTAEDFRAMWALLDGLWEDTFARAERLGERALHERVDGEWSFVETVRHLVFAIDVWIGRMIGGEPLPYHRLGLPPTDYPEQRAIEIGIDRAVRPSYAEAAAVHAERAAGLRRVLAGLTDAGLEEPRTAEPAPEWGEMTCSVGDCLRVVLREHCEHRRFAVRDLAALDARRQG